MNPSLWLITDNEKYYLSLLFDTYLTKYHASWPDTYRYILDIKDYENDFTVLETISNTNPNRHYIYNINYDNNHPKHALFDLLITIKRSGILATSNKELCLTWSGKIPVDVYLLLLKYGIDYLILSGDLKRYLDLRDKWLCKTRIGCMFSEDRKEFGDFIIFNDGQLDYLAYEDSGQP